AKRLLGDRDEDRGVHQHRDEQEQERPELRRAIGSGIVLRHKRRVAEAIRQELQNGNHHHWNPDQPDDGAELAEGEAIGEADGLADGQLVHAQLSIAGTRRMPPAQLTRYYLQQNRGAISGQSLRDTLASARIGSSWTARGPDGNRRLREV